MTWTKAGENLSKIAKNWDRRNSLPDNSGYITESRSESQEGRNGIHRNNSKYERISKTDMERRNGPGQSSSKTPTVPDKRASLTRRRMSLPDRRRSQHDVKENIPGRRRRFSLDQRVCSPDIRGLRRISESTVRQENGTQLVGQIFSAISAVGLYVCMRKLESLFN